MKVRVYVAAGLLVGTMATSASAFAEDQASIDNTGNGSNNQITFNRGDSCYIINNNTIYLTNNNQQISTTGQVTIDSNTGAGSATSGAAGNINNATFQGVITNAGTCGAAPVVQPQTPVTPTPEQPQVQSAQTTAAAPQVKAPVGGVAAGVGSTDTTGALVGALAAGVAAIGFGLRRFAAIRK